MNKPLTVEQLKALEVGDWVWIVNLNLNQGMYVTVDEDFISERKFVGQDYLFYPKYQDYGNKWIAYKNKEQAEKGGQLI